MYCQIIQLRTNGKRQPDRATSQDVGIFGAVTLMQIGYFRRMRIHAWEDGSHQKPLVPDLYEPVIASMVGNGMLLRGLQTNENGETHLQEWTVRFIGENPP